MVRSLPLEKLQAVISMLKALPFSLLHPTWTVGEAESLESISACVGADEGCLRIHCKANRDQIFPMW